MADRATRFGLVHELNPPTGRGRGVRSDDEDLFQRTDRVSQEAVPRRAEVARLAEVLAPDYAKERGISVDEARAELTGGVADEETPIHGLGRALLGWTGLVKAPEGEDIRVRTGRLEGMQQRRYGVDPMLRKEQRDVGKDLRETAEMVANPSEKIEGALARALRGGGADIPESEGDSTTPLGGMRNLPKNDFQAEIEYPDEAARVYGHRADVKETGGGEQAWRQKYDFLKGKGLSEEEALIGAGLKKGPGPNDDKTGPAQRKLDDFMGKRYELNDGTKVSAAEMLRRIDLKQRAQPPEPLTDDEVSFRDVYRAHWKAANAERSKGPNKAGGESSASQWFKPLTEE